MEQEQPEEEGDDAAAPLDQMQDDQPIYSDFVEEDEASEREASLNENGDEVAQDQEQDLDEG